MDNESNEFSMDDFNEGVESAENTEAITEEIKTEEAESPTETKAESESEDKGDVEAKDGEDSGAESPAAEEYNPDFSYKIKDEKKEFPEFLRGVVKSKEEEEQVRDLLTRAEAIEGLKESRGKVEAEYNGYKQDIENNVYPVLDKIGAFDQANAVGDFRTAWELSDVNPNDVIDYMMMDKDLSEKIFSKVLEHYQMEEQGGPQAIEAQRRAWEEQNNSRALEMQNKSLESRLIQMETNSFNNTLDFVLSQNQDAASKYDAHIGQEGAFRNFVSDYNFLQRQKGINLSPSDAVQGAMKTLGLSNQAQEQGNNEQLNEHAKVTPQATKQPETIPNLGTGSNVSMVQASASNWDDWKKSMGSSF